MKHKEDTKKETTAATASTSGSPNAYRFGRLRIDRPSRSVFLGSEEIFFTTTDFDLLWLLASHAGKVLSRDDIMKELGGMAHDNSGRLIDMRISRLRKRLSDDTENPRRIKTVRGQGYLFNPSDRD